MSKNKKIPFQIYLVVYFSLALLGASLGTEKLLSIPADPKNEFLFGYSPARLILILFFMALIVGTAYLAFKSWKEPNWANRVEKTLFNKQSPSGYGLAISVILFLLFGLFLLIPSSQLGQFAVYAERLHPFAIFMTQISFQTIVFLLKVQASDWKSLFSEMRESQMTLWVGVILASLSGIIVLTGLGVKPTAQTYWYETGVPVLGLQILLIILMATITDRLISWAVGKAVHYFPEIPQWINIIISVLIWGTTALLWIRSPMASSFFAPGPFPPGNSYLPFSDAATYDTYAQYALMGKGIANQNIYAGHNAYIAFLAFLHLLAGQDFLLLVNLQVALFAIFPAIVFLIGKTLHSRFLGIFLAGVVMVQEVNAYASGSRLNLSHSKLLMTEFPTKIGIALLILLLILWLQKPKKNSAYAFPIGALLGILMMVRYNTLILPFAVIAGIALVFGKDWKKTIKSSMVLILAFFIVISPWMWRSWKISANPLFFAQKVFSRLNTVQNEYSVSLNTSTAFGTGIESATPQSGITENPSLPATNETQNDLLPSQGKKGKSFFDKNGSIYLLGNHFVHSLITNFLILPSEPLFEYLPSAIAKGTIYKNSPYWKTNEKWLQNLSLINQLGIGLNLLILSIGLGTSFRKWKLVGWIPWGFSLSYYISTAIIHDSGGRYLVPVDWIIFLYFGIGLLQIVHWGRVLLSSSIEPFFHTKGTMKKDGDFSAASFEKPISTTTGLFLALPLFLYVLSMTILDQTLPQKHMPTNQSEVIEQLVQIDLLDQSAVDLQNLENFLQTPNARVIYGMIQYPRFFWKNYELYYKPEVYRSQPYPRLVFTVFGELANSQVILPLRSSPETLSHGNNVIVIGCYEIDNSQYGNFGYIDALLIADLGNDPTIYMRSSIKPLAFACPLPELE